VNPLPFNANDAPSSDVKHCASLQLKGAAHEVEGAIKATTGKVTGNSKLEAEGHVENADGKLQKKVGQVEKVIEK
jgi:uncharacterized protein YjbJ (UPF0337 family)